MVHRMMNMATDARIKGAERKKPLFPRLLLGILSFMATVGIRPMRLSFLDSKSKLSDVPPSGWLERYSDTAVPVSCLDAVSGLLDTAWRKTKDPILPVWQLYDDVIACVDHHAARILDHVNILRLQRYA